MNYKKPTLTIEEKSLHGYLLEVAGGIGCTTALSKLNLTAEQIEVLQRLKSKGYVHLSPKSFMMLLPVD